LRGTLAATAGFSLAPSVPSIPRARSDLTSRQGSDALAPSVAHTPSAFEREVSTWVSSSHRLGALHGSHWSAQASVAIPAPETSRWRSAAPYQPIHPAQQPRVTAGPLAHALLGGREQAQKLHPRHAHALGPHESMHAYPTANVAVAAGSLSARF
jgi:hypothetical protein